MKRLVRACAFALGAGSLVSGAAFDPSGAQAAGMPAAHTQTVRLAVTNMTCSTCPITVKEAIQRVAGVRSVVVDLGSKRAEVTFDPRRTDAASIAAASTNAGFPAKPVG